MSINMENITKTRYMFRLVIFLVIFIPSFVETVRAANSVNKHTANTYGGIGLIQTPSARFSDDGEFSFGLSTESPYNRLYATVQFFPWMEATLRYTEGTYKPYYEGNRQTWKDKGLDLKFRLFKEGDLIPEVAFGFTDFGGTGIFSSEYIVATKSLDNIDFTLGLGWGRLAGLDHLNNIAGWLDDERKTRGGSSSYGGKVNLNRLFSGENSSIFAGIEYFSNVPNLSLKLEYDTSDYSGVIGSEKKIYQTGDIFELDSRLNYAINYALELGERDRVDFSLGYLRGNTIYANLTVHSNLNFAGNPKTILGAERIRNTNLPGGEAFATLNKKRQKFLTDRTIKEMARIGFVTHNIIYNGNELSAEISQGRFQDPTLAIDLASRVLANNSPKNIKTITVINIDQGIETLRSSLQRDDIIDYVSKGAIPEESIIFNERNENAQTMVVRENEYLYPNFFWSIRPNMLGTLQHQRKFYFWQLEALIHANYSIKKGLYFTTDIGINIDNNYEDYTFHVPDGKLHHVRQDRRLYLTEGESGLRRMKIEYLTEINPNIKARLSAGYLEWMYGGIGGEILYIPDNKRWALGVDTYWVKQREFDQKFSFQDYETVTGFLTYYRDIPFYDMRFKLSAGKFLGKDKGVHIDISRRFDTGARIGGIVALTDCDSACVGEGSFNKWIYFELPMDLFYIQSTTRNKTGYSWAPLTKDAGQKVENGSLYSLVMNATDEVESLRQKSWSIKKIFSGFGTQPKERI